MALEYKIKPEEFGWLSLLFNETTPISPLALFAERRSSFNDDNKINLITQNIIDSSGNLFPEPFAVFQTLANVKSYTRLRIMGVDAPIDKIVYFDGKTRCSVDAGPDNLMIKYPPLDDEIGFAFSEYTGTSRFVNVDFKTKLPRDAAKTFLLAMDVVRQRNLLLLARMPASYIFTVSDLLAEQDAQHSLFHLSAVLDALTSLPNLNVFTLESSLEILAHHGFVEKVDTGWLFTRTSMNLAMQMLVPEYHFNIVHGEVDSNTSVVKSECYVSLFGIHDLLYIDQDGDDVVIETMSGSDLYLILMNAVS